MTTLLKSTLNAVGYIRLNRPEKYNSFTREMALAVQNALDEYAHDKTIRCIVITGEGKAFSAGQDLQEAVEDNGIELQRIVAEHYNPIIKKIRRIEKPIVAAVNGVAAGAGANIAIACDISVATKSASFIQAFSKIGLIPDSGGTYFLPRILGMQTAAGLMMTGDKLSADEACRLGLIYKVFPDYSFEADYVAMAEKLASMPTYGLALTKHLLNETWNNTMDVQLALEDDLQTQAGMSYDYKEGTAAFLEKRKPEFRGE